MPLRTHFTRECSGRAPTFHEAIQPRPISTRWSTSSCAGSKPPRIQLRGPDMPRQVELDPPQSRVSAAEKSPASNATNAPAPIRPKRLGSLIFGRVLVAFLFAIVVLVGLIYF